MRRADAHSCILRLFIGAAQHHAISEKESPQPKGKYMDKGAKKGGYFWTAVPVDLGVVCCLSLVVFLSEDCYGSGSNLCCMFRNHSLRTCFGDDRLSRQNRSQGVYPINRFRLLSNKYRAEPAQVLPGIFLWSSRSAAREGPPFGAGKGNSRKKVRFSLNFSLLFVISTLY